jgi:hypothetical protein
MKYYNLISGVETVPLLNEEQLLIELRKLSGEIILHGIELTDEEYAAEKEKYEEAD